MQTWPVSRYIYMGTALRYLMDARTGYKIGGDAHVLFNLNRLLSLLRELNLVVTVRAADLTLGPLKQELAGATTTINTDVGANGYVSAVKGQSGTTGSAK